MNEDYIGARNALTNRLEHNENALTLYLLSRSLLYNQSPNHELDAIDRSIDIVPTSRSYHQKVMIFNPYLEGNDDSQLLSKNLYIENVLISLNADIRNFDSYADLLHFLQQEGLNIDLPDKDVYLREIRKTNSNFEFTKGIQRILQKNKPKLLNAALPLDEEKSKDFKESVESISLEEDLYFDISNQELMEDSLDEFLNDDY